MLLLHTSSHLSKFAGLEQLKPWVKVSRIISIVDPGDKADGSSLSFQRANSLVGSFALWVLIKLNDIYPTGGHHYCCDP